MMPVLLGVVRTSEKKRARRKLRNIGLHRRMVLALDYGPLYDVG